MKLILASQSPRRREILAKAGYTFDVRVSDIDEIIDYSLPPGEIAAELARQKALAVFDGARGVVLAADTIVVLDGQILGKPENEKHATEMLSLLSGRVHKVFTGVYIISASASSSFFVETDVSFYALTSEEIAAYIATGEPSDKAGAYGIQGYGSLLVEKINGDYFNVMGLPVSRTTRELRGFGIYPARDKR